MARAVAFLLGFTAKRRVRFEERPNTSSCHLDFGRCSTCDGMPQNSGRDDHFRVISLRVQDSRGWPVSPFFGVDSRSIFFSTHRSLQKQIWIGFVGVGSFFSEKIRIFGEHGNGSQPSFFLLPPDESAARSWAWAMWRCPAC